LADLAPRGAIVFEQVNAARNGPVPSGGSDPRLSPSERDRGPESRTDDAVVRGQGGRPCPAGPAASKCIGGARPLLELVARSTDQGGVAIHRKRAAEAVGAVSNERRLLHPARTGANEHVGSPGRAGKQGVAVDGNR